MIGEQATSAGDAFMLAVEQAVTLCVRPRPRWLPERLWRAIVARLFLLEFGPLRVRWLDR